MPPMRWRRTSNSRNRRRKSGHRGLRWIKDAACRRRHTVPMLPNLLSGTGLVTLTVLLHTSGLLLLGRLTPILARRLGFHSHDAGRTLVMTGSVLGIFLLHTFEIWLWAWGYFRLAAVASFADALDLSTAMFSTLGYGG